MEPQGWWHIVAKLLQCLQFHAWEQPLSPAWVRLQFPAWEHLPVPCLGMLAVPAWDACQFPAWERLPVPCLGTIASALPLHVLQSLPGTLCQFPAWERLPMPCLGMLASPCLGMLLAGTLSLCYFLMLICASSSLICHAPLQNNGSKKNKNHSA